MNRRKPVTGKGDGKETRITRRVKNQTGRVDVLASRLLEEVVLRSNNPVLAIAHQQLAAPLLDPLIHYYLGPRNKHVRKVTRIVRKVVNAAKTQTGVREAGR